MTQVPPLHDGLIEERQFESAWDLLEYLDRSRPHWSNRWDCGWVFRGQRDADWELVPSAWRGTDPAFEKVREKMVAASQAAMFAERRRYEVGPVADLERINECIGQAAAELQVVNDFVEIADQIGLPVLDPPRTDGLSLILSIHNQPEPVSFRPPFFPEPTTAFGLAQHHGIPTRLLDFSYRPEVAAFFAADHVLENGDSDGRLAVWAVERIHSSLSTGFKLNSMTVPRSQHNFLHAQDGLFIWAPTGDYDGLIGEGMTRRSLNAIADQSRLMPEQLPLFRKATLPKSEAPELLRLLHLQNVTKAHLMPSYSSVSDVVRRKILYG